MKMIIKFSLFLYFFISISSATLPPNKVSGLSDNDILVVKIQEVYAGKLSDLNGLGENDFYVKLEFYLSGSKNGDDFYSENYFLGESKEINLKKGETVFYDKRQLINDLEIRVRGARMNSIIAADLPFYDHISLKIIFYEYSPMEDRRIARKLIYISELNDSPFNFTLQDSKTYFKEKSSYQEAQGFLGWGEVVEKTKTTYYGHYDKNVYAKISMSIERDVTYSMAGVLDEIKSVGSAIINDWEEKSLTQFLNINYDKSLYDDQSLVTLFPSIIEEYHGKGSRADKLSLRKPSRYCLWIKRVMPMDDSPSAMSKWSKDMWECRKSIGASERQCLTHVDGAPEKNTQKNVLAWKKKFYQKCVEKHDPISVSCWERYGVPGNLDIRFFSETSEWQENMTSCREAYNDSI